MSPTAVAPSHQTLRRVMAPKVEGAWTLHRVTRHLPLEHFVLFSSAAAVFGADLGAYLGYGKVGAKRHQKKAIRETILGYIAQRVRAALQSGKAPGPEGSIAKLAGSELVKRAANLHVELFAKLADERLGGGRQHAG